MAKSKDVVVAARRATQMDEHQASTALRMRRNGQGYPEIADHLGIDPWTAQQLVGIAYRRIASEEVHELRAAVEDRLDDLLRRMHQDLALADDQNTRNGIYRLILSTEAQRSKLLGLDIPPGTPDVPIEGEK